MPACDEQTDVLVVGSGIAGLAAAIEARQAGATVVVLEKMKIIGGNTRISDSCLAAPGNPIQKKKGVEDSPELFYQDMIRAGLGLNHTQLTRVLAEKAQSAVDWTIENLGVVYLDRLDRFGGHSVARCITTQNHRGIDLIKALRSKLDQLGGTIRTQCLLQQLLTDASGVVCGAQIRVGYQFGDEESGCLTTVHAKKGVVLATGGYGNDVSFRTLQHPSLTESVGSTNHRGATAEALIAALRAGAAPIHLSWIQLGPWGCSDEKGYGQGASFASYSVYPAGILIDPATGCRIVNEWADRRQRSDAIFKTGHECIGIVDAKGAQKASESLKSCLKRGSIKQFERLSDLARHYQLPKHSLEATVRQYNQDVQAGEIDAFGKNLRAADTVAHPPFCGIRLWPKIHYTPGGLGMTPTAQVIDLYGNPIPHLFAAGEVCGGVHGASRLGSCALVECIVFGRIAGQQASLNRSLTA